MVTQPGRINDPNDAWSERPEGRGSRGTGVAARGDAARRWYWVARRTPAGNPDPQAASEAAWRP